MRQLSVNPTNFKPYLAVLSLVALQTYCPLAFGEETDVPQFDLNVVYECDTLFCPTGESEKDAKELLSGDLGFEIDSSQPRETKNLRVIRTYFESHSSTSSSPTNQQMHAATTVPPLPGHDSAFGRMDHSGPGQQGLPPRQERQRRQQPTAMGGGGGGGAAMGGGSPGMGAGGGGMQMQPQGGGISLSPGQVRAGGFLYSDDRGDKPSTPSKPQNVVQNSMRPHNPAVEQNRQNQGLKRETGSQSPQGRQLAMASAMPGGQAQPGGPFGQYESGGSRGSGGKNSKGQSSTSALRGIAQKLGLDRFFGGQGGGGSKGQRAAQAGAHNQQPDSKSRDPSHKKLLDPRTILQRKMNVYRQRGLASSPEFGDSETSIFRSMCQHYIRYANRHHIPRSPQSQCPQ